LNRQLLRYHINVLVVVLLLRGILIVIVGACYCAEKFLYWIVIAWDTYCCWIVIV